MQRFPFHRFNSPEHQAWKLDRSRRQRIPIEHAWRGCIGLAILWKNVDAGFECVGDRIFYDNEQLVWACLRDIPAGNFPGCPSMNRRDVNLASLTQATLCYGRPKLDFASSRDTWDFRRMPYGTVKYRENNRVREITACGDTLNCDDRPREFAVFNRLSAAMTRQAFFGVDSRRRWIRSVWSRTQPRRVPVPFVPVAEFFPRAFLGFDKANLAKWFEQHPHAARAERPTDAFCDHRLVDLKRWPALRFLSLHHAIAICPTLTPVQMVWECSPLERWVDPRLETAVLPAFSCKRWAEVRVNLVNVDVDASTHHAQFRLNTKQTSYNSGTTTKVA